MKKLSSSTLVLAVAFSVLLIAYLGSRVVQYEAGQRERSRIEQQPGVREQKRKMAAGVLAVDAAGQKMRDEIAEKDQELTKAGIHGEQRKREMLKAIASSRQEMNRTFATLRRQQ